MDLKNHYESYRASLHRDSLEGFVDYAKAAPTGDPKRWPNTYDYISDIVVRLQHAVGSGDDHKYKELVQCHREAMLMLFEKMVSDFSKTFEHDEDKILKVVDRGWNWYKFSRGIVRFDNHVWIPRYCAHFDTEINGDKPVFSANEMKVLLERKPYRTIADAILENKKKQRFYVLDISKFGAVTARPLSQINTPLVTDWTMELFQ
jgi:hypothetical protein